MRAVVGHSVSNTRDVGAVCKIAMKMLVEHQEPKQVGRSQSGSGTSLGWPHDGGGVVGECVECVLLNITVVRKYIVVGDDPSQFKV